MFREYVILLCAGSFVSGIAVYSGDKNAPAKSQAPTSVAAKQQDRLALPSQVSSQNTASPSTKYLSNSAPSYQTNSAVVDTISEAIPAKSVIVQSYGSPNVQQQTVFFSASVASDPSSPEYNNALERHAPAVGKIIYNIKPAVKTVSVPVPVTKKVTIGAYNSVQTHRPLAPKYAPAPIPVPVIYQQLEPQYAAEQQIAVVPTSASYAQAPVGVQHIPVPVYTTNGAKLQYHPIPVSGGHQHGYAKAVVFSPASEVSRVSFNGLGVTYGW